jgi:hypothetical protein
MGVRPVFRVRIWVDLFMFLTGSREVSGFRRKHLLFEWVVPRVPFVLLRCDFPLFSQETLVVALHFLGSFGCLLFAFLGCFCCISTEFLFDEHGSEHLCYCF